MDKTFDSPAAAVADVPDGASLAVGGFGLCGVPIQLIQALLAQGATDLRDRVEQLRGRWLPGSACCSRPRRISRTVGSYVGENKEFARQYLAGELEVELTPARHAR